jgi:hypothetical protein
MVPVLFAFMGFAVDLARLYMVRMELQTAANSAALSAAARLIGTEASSANAATQARFTYSTQDGGEANRYNFDVNTLTSSDSFLTSEVNDPQLYETREAAVSGSGGEAGGTTAKYARVRIRAEAPVIFFGFLPVAQERKAAIEVAAVAGVSSPLCTACGIEPLVIAAADISDTADFGFVRGTRYTFGFQCTGNPTPVNLAGATGRIPYLLLNRYNDQATLYPDESSQAFRNGAQGMPPTATPDNPASVDTYATRSCMTVLTDEAVWASATPRACNTNSVPGVVTAFLCGLSTRFDATTVPSACASVPEVDAMFPLYAADTDITDLEDYTAYTGTARRIITVPVVETLTTGTMQPLGFRQFLIEPNPDSVTLNPGDNNGRFNALYIGAPMPLRQGRFDGCQLASGPGKVVLHQ